MWLRDHTLPEIYHDFYKLESTLRILSQKLQLLCPNGFWDEVLIIFLYYSQVKIDP